MTSETIKILFFGDIVGRPGRFVVRDYLADLKEKNALPDFVIANCENASHGFGLTENNYNQLLEYGIDCLTSGNHIFDKKDIFTFIENADRLVRPFNYPNGVPGAGSRILGIRDQGLETSDCKQDEADHPVKIAVINILGQTFLPPIDSPWTGAIEEIKRLKEITPIVIVDFHAEATAEKICFGKYCSDFGVSAFLGTHTHVQTADEKITDNGMAYITDAGSCGAAEGVIGMDYETSLKRFTTGLPERYDVSDEKPYMINAVEIEVEVATGCATSISRIFVNIDK